MLWVTANQSQITQNKPHGPFTGLAAFQPGRYSPEAGSPWRPIHVRPAHIGAAERTGARHGGSDMGTNRKNSGARNLIPLPERTKADQRKIRSMGGKASGIARRERRTMRQWAELLRDEPANDNTDMTHGQAAVVAAWREAERGNITAHRFLSELMKEMDAPAITNTINSPIVLGLIPQGMVDDAKRKREERNRRDEIALQKL